MRYPRKWQLAFVCLLALALLPLMPAQHGTAQAPGYTVTDLGTLGGDASRAFGLDECGRVVGDSQSEAGAASPFRPFRWSSGAGMIDLGTLGGLGGTAYAINQGDTTAGSAMNAGGNLRAFVRPPAGPPQDIGSLGGSTVEAYDINGSGQVVGASEASGGGSLDDRAYVWKSGTMQVLTATWGTPVRADGINEAGQVAGTASHNTSGTHAFLWKDTNGNGQSDPGEVNDLGTLGGLISFATEVNDLGEVVGYSYVGSNSSDPSHAFFWKDLNLDGDGVTGAGAPDPGEMIDLGTLGGRFSSAYDLNDSGLVVGSAQTSMSSSDTHAFVWSSAGGMKDLNTVVPGTGWTFQDARAINDRGQIAGFGLNPDGKVHAFLLTPSNDPGPPPACSATPTPTPTPGTLQFSAATYSVGEGNTSVVISVSRTGGDDGAVQVSYATSNGTAAANPGGDYEATSGVLEFLDGETTKTFSVTVTDDTLDEANETVNLTLSNPTGGASLGSQTTAVLTITDNDPQPTLQFSSATYSVGEGGATATVTVTRSGGSNAVTVNYATSNGTATAGSDYTAASGTLTFAAGDNSESFTVAITNDALDEENETVNLTLSSPGGGAALGSQSTATLTINDNDDPPSLSVNDATVTEGNSGTTNATFTVTLSAPSGQTVTVLYITGAITAAEVSDFTAVSSSLTFNPGETSKTVNVEVIGDTLDEADETFTFNIGTPSNATIGDAQGLGTITDDDGAPSLSINDVTLSEGNSGTTSFTFTVTKTGSTALDVTVNYATADGTAQDDNPTSEDSDYAPTSGTLTFAANEGTKTVTVLVNGDALEEPNETFSVTLSSPTNATVSDGTGVGTINDDDPTPFLSINDVAVNEGNSGDSAATFTVTLSAPSGQTVSVNYASADGTANAGPDYGATAGTLTFAPGETTKTITVNAFGDTFNEPNETFFVNLSSPSNASVADGQGQGTINNDDAPTFNFSQATYPAGESAHFVTITVQRTGDATSAARVNFATSDGTASERRDYTAVSGRLQFAAGETSKTFDVLLTVDAYAESEETVNLTLSNPTGGAALGSQSTATVNIQDTPPPGPNPIDIASDFVRQHYHDFLSREPDASGLAFWTGQMTNCGNPNLEICRINVSAAFFQAIEFQQTGYLVYRTYKAAYGDTTSPGVPGTVPIIRLQEFLPDTRIIGDGVIVGPPGWEDTLNANKNAYMQEFVQRPRFTAADAFPLSMTAAQFVDKLNQNAGGVLTQGERDSLVAQLSPAPSDTAARAAVLRAVAENPALQQNEFRRAFVLMQYYGYLRRNPDDAPEQNLNFGGWNFWLGKLNDFNGNFVQAQMVKAFLDSIEYRTRFAP